MHTWLLPPSSFMPAGTTVPLFKTAYLVSLNVEPVWHLPFRIGGVRLAFDGYADYNTPKGKDAAGRDTRAEFIARPLLKVDVSPVVGRQSHVLELGVGFGYWHKKFGKDASRVPGRTSSRRSSRWPCTCRSEAPDTDDLGGHR